MMKKRAQGSGITGSANPKNNSIRLQKNVDGLTQPQVLRAVRESKARILLFKGTTSPCWYLRRDQYHRRWFEKANASRDALMHRGLIDAVLIINGSVKADPQQIGVLARLLWIVRER